MRKVIDTGYGCTTCRVAGLLTLEGTDLVWCKNPACEDYIKEVAR